jgi:carbon storage regulator CsrA
MLILSRRPHEKILLPTISAAIEVVAIKPGVVRLGILAPPEVPVVREELQDRSCDPLQSVRTPSACGAENLAPNLLQVARNRLQIAGRGLAVLRRQLEAGQTQDAALTLDSLEDDLRRVLGRLEAKESSATAQMETGHRVRDRLLRRPRRRSRRRVLCCV